jgi:hypothetical protein
MLTYEPVFELHRSKSLFWVGRDSVVGRSWMVRGSNPVGAKFSAPVQTGPGAHPASCTMGTGSLSRG